MELEGVTLGLIQMAMGPDPGENIEKARRKVIEAAGQGAQIICLPELFHVRYFPQHSGAETGDLAETIPGRSTILFASLAREHNIVIILPVYEKTADGKFFNAAVVIDADGNLSEPYHKIHIPQDPGFYEKGYFYPGDSFRVFPTRYGKIAVLICFDQWFPEAARCLALDGADIILYPTAIGHPGPDTPKEGGWQEAWELIQRSHAVANSVHVAAVNRVGTEGSCRFFGGSFVADAFGKVLSRAGDSEEILVVKVDFTMNTEVQDSWGFFRNRRPETYYRITVPFAGKEGRFPDLRKKDTPQNRGFHMPAEWEPHDAVWISWPHNTYTFPDIPAVEQAYYEFIAHVHTSERVEVFVPTAIVYRKVRARLNEMGIVFDRVTLHTTGYSDFWNRDYGLTLLVSTSLKILAMSGWESKAWVGKHDDRFQDGTISLPMNRWRHLTLAQ
ncbi:nitrilase-related carbon-nitrogen hydrolase [Methanoregula sp.]|uniref:nitrilase-related carbon-nitrogen hydrolase n=1 Tax=Methanoregula sp. TaxID=2052170 RepID=UPI0025F0F882|nr:nitrilase-related carbon-nitrogen hydrolase [Methanoregula sp.]